MKRFLLILLFAACFICYNVLSSNKQNVQKTNTGAINRMATGPYGVEYVDNPTLNAEGQPVIVYGNPSLPSDNTAPIDYGSGGGGTAPTGPVIDYNALQQYDQAIGNTQAGINRLDTQLNSGYGSIDTSYNNALNQLLLGKNQGETAYNQNKQDTATNYVGAKNTIGSQAGSTLNGLLRLLGSRGAGGGSAARIAAPQAVARGASLQRSDVGNTFGSNNRALDTNWNNYLTGYENQRQSAWDQRGQGRLNLEQQINNNRGNLLQTLADLQGKRSAAAGGSYAGGAQGSLDQANALYDKTANYTINPINYQTQAYQAPSVASYTVNPQATPTYNQSGPSDYFSPYLQSLLGKKQQGAVA